MMRRLAIALACSVLALGATASTAWAGSPHFIKSALSASAAPDTLTVSGKEAGLGDESQIHVILKATALCINGGGHHPKAVNKESLSAAGDKAAFQPDYAPPMTVAFTDISLMDTTNNLTASIPGTLP